MQVNKNESGTIDVDFGYLLPKMEKNLPELSNLSPKLPFTPSLPHQNYSDCDSRVEKTEFYRESIKKALSDTHIMNTLTFEQIYLLRNGRMSYITGEEKEEFIYDILYNIFVVTEELYIEHRCKILEKRLRGPILEFYQALNKSTDYFGDIMDPLMEEFGYEKDIDYFSTFPHYDQTLIRDSLPSQDEAYNAFQLQKQHSSDIKKLDLHCNFCGKPNHLEKSCFKKKRERVLSSKNLPESQEQCQSDLSQSDLNNSSPIVHDKHPDLTCSSDPKEIIDPTDAYDENFDELLRCYQQLMERYKRILSKKGREDRQ
uniref:CCHC-type domain-containing protein n=1 Tax=Bursaphelenchus xylophilus TaxID=6326 RepID=A0A1I7SJW9_BURXY